MTPRGSSSALTAPEQQVRDQLGQSAGDAQFVSDFFTLSASRSLPIRATGAVNPANVTAALVPPSINGYYTLALNAAGTDYMTRPVRRAELDRHQLSPVTGCRAGQRGLTLNGTPAPVVAAGAGSPSYQSGCNRCEFLPPS